MPSANLDHEKQVERETQVESIKDHLAKLLAKNNINNVEISGRPKHVYSIYKKMTQKGKPFDLRELFARIRAKLRTKSFEDAIRRRNRQLSMLPEIGKELSARLDINELTSVVLRRTVEMLGAIMGHIVLLDPHHPVQNSYNTSAAAVMDYHESGFCIPGLADQ